MTPSNEQSYKRKLRVLREVRFRDCVVSVWTEFIIGTYRPAHTHKSQIRNSNNRLTLATLLPNRTVETFLCCTHTHTKQLYWFHSIQAAICCSDVLAIYYSFSPFLSFTSQFVPCLKFPDSDLFQVCSFGIYVNAWHNSHHSPSPLNRITSFVHITRFVLIFFYLPLLLFLILWHQIDKSQASNA